MASNDSSKSIMGTEYEILQSCENDACVNEIDQIEAEIAKCIISYNETKEKYKAALIENLKKDLILHKLLNRGTEHFFAEFGDRFSTETIDKLHSFGNAETCDSTFILTAVRALYIHNLTDLKNKTYSGKPTINSKEPISPEKMKSLKDIFDKRLEYIEFEDGVMNDERKKKFSRHVKNAIESINKMKN